MRSLARLVDRLRARLNVDGGGYSAWARRFDRPSLRELRRRREEAARFRHLPTVSLLLPLHDAEPASLDATIRSVRRQSYSHWELCVASGDPPGHAITRILRRHVRADPRIRLASGDGHGSIAALASGALGLATGTYVARLGQGDLLAPLALHWIVEAINRCPGAALVYSDEDKVDGLGRRFEPYFKGDFNQVLLLAQDCIARLGVYRRDVVQGVGGFREGFRAALDHDLALRCAAASARHEIVHVPRVLYHRRATDGAAPTAESVEAARRAVTEHVHRFDAGATVEPAPDWPLGLRVRHSLPSPPPLVSIIICTRDQGKLLRAAIDSIRSRTTYEDHEIVVLDNGSRDAGTLDYLAHIARQPRMTLVRDDSPFNYSRLNNAAVRHARGSILCLLNDDVEVLAPGWLEEMVSFAVQPGIGAVGARLWYPDGTLQHGGVIIGVGGVAGHAHPRLARGQAGYFGRGVLQQELSAVTGACLVVRREIFEAVGGFDDRIEVAFNDVDLCLRIRTAGYRNVWTPFAELIHHESASRGYEDTPEKVARFEREVRFMQERWGASLRTDPHYNPNLSMRSGDFAVECPRPRDRP